MLQNLLYFNKKKTQVVVFFFGLHFEQLLFFTYECPGPGAGPLVYVIIHQTIKQFFFG